MKRIVLALAVHRAGRSRPRRRSTSTTRSTPSARTRSSTTASTGRPTVDALHDLSTTTARSGSLQKVASFAESAYDDISRAAQLPDPEVRSTSSTTPTHSDFEQTNTDLNFISEGVGAFALPSRNRMVLPVDLPDEKLQQLIAHELTHVFQFEILFGGNYLRAMTTNAPQWFLEGMASYFGNDEDNKDRMVLRDAVLSDRVPEIAQRGIYGFFAYRFGHAVFDFITAEWGKDAVRDFLFEYRNQIGPSVEKAPSSGRSTSPARTSTSSSAGTFASKYLKILTEKGEPIDFGEKFKIEDTPSAELSPRAYPSGDFVAAISTYKEDADVVVMSTRERKLFKNLTKGRKTAYEYLVSQWITTGPQQGVDLAVSNDGNTHRRLRAPRTGPRPAAARRVERRHPRAHRDAGHRSAAQPGLLSRRDDGRLPRDARRPGRHLRLQHRHALDHEPDGRRVLRLRPGLLARRQVDLLLLGPRDADEDLPDAARVAGHARAGHLRRRERRGRVALARRPAALLHLRPRRRHLQHLLARICETGETYLHTNVVGGCFGPTAFIGRTTPRSSSSPPITRAASSSTSRTRRSRCKQAAGALARDHAGDSPVQVAPYRAGDRGLDRPGEGDAPSPRASSTSRTRRCWPASTPTRRSIPTRC